MIQLGFHGRAERALHEKGVEDASALRIHRHKLAAGTGPRTYSNRRAGLCQSFMLGAQLGRCPGRNL